MTAQRRIAVVARRLTSLIRKEVIQVSRDPATLLIGVALPPVLLVLFAFAVSLDIKQVPVGLVLEHDGARARSLAAAYAATPWLTVHAARDRREIEPKLVSGEYKAMIVIPQDFEARLLRRHEAPAIQIITDGAQPNSAGFVAGFGQGVFNTWLEAEGLVPVRSGVRLETRFWFNPELDSRRVILPGAIALVMTIIGTLLTSMVIAREWERGTMEALMATPATMLEIIISKLVPYFVLGTGATVLCCVLTVKFLGVPLRGSVFALAILSAVFLLVALGQGLLISTLTRNQFLASQASLMSAFLPALLLSGFVFEIKSMPWMLQMITYAVPARHFVGALQTIFLAGDVWSQLIRDLGALLLIATVFYGITLHHSRKRLD